ncbi:MAG: hypothetical protein ACYTF1_05800 [Planctomycetota bacterium]|jgi:hypothetical protein
MADYEAQEARVEAILGDYEALEVIDDCVERFYRHLAASLQLPCEVTGIEDFRWEEFYVLGPGDPDEYEELRRTQPSYEDIYDLLAIEHDVESEWMMFRGDDLGAHVRRKSDGKEFYLGLAEIEAVDKDSLNYQLLDDYSVWLVNNR